MFDYQGRMLFLCLIFASAVLYLLIELQMKTTTKVQTDCGMVEGESNIHGYAFRGIPYALPPVGNLRWKPPVPLSHSSGTCWKGVREALNYGNTCLQYYNGNRSSFLGSEDCLYLNVWTPTTNKDANLDVMVWIHGGYLIEANANWPTYCPSEKLAKETNIVYVGMNYRLHAFGFMALDLLSEASETKTSGNYGFMDQILALKWVQNNIQYFGGNPNKVTIFGQSSGGTSIYALLASPMAKGLFQKAWLLSASPILNKSLEDASEDNLVFLKKTGCKDISCLYRLSGQAVMQAIPWDEYPHWAMEDLMDLPTKGRFDGALAIVDGYVLKKSPHEAWKSGTANKVPLLIGSTAQEIDIDPVKSDIKNWTWSDYQRTVEDHLEPFGKSIANFALKEYPRGEVTPEYQYTTLASDIRVTCGTDTIARSAAMYTDSRVYRYVVTSSPSKPVHSHAFGIEFGSKYSFHLWDVFAFFGTISDYIKMSDSDIRFQQNVRSEILSFVKTGAPATRGWRVFPDKTALLSSVTRPVSSYHEKQCLFWHHHGLVQYSWIN